MAEMHQQLTSDLYHSSEMQEFATLRDQIIDGVSMVVPGHSETDQLVSCGYFSYND